MDNEADWLTLDGPWECVICVQGALALDGAARLGGLRLTPATGAAATELRGVLHGQAAVLGALTTLHALGFPVRSMTCTPLGAPRRSRPVPPTHTDAAGGGAQRRPLRE